jgi:hypothetical protein
MQLLNGKIDLVSLSTFLSRRVTFGAERPDAANVFSQRPVLLHGRCAF